VQFKRAHKGLKGCYVLRTRSCEGRVICGKQEKIFYVQLTKSNIDAATERNNYLSTTALP